MDEPVERMQVDLSLAVNYVPACSCVVRVLVLLLFTSHIDDAYEIGGYVLVSLLVYLDRITNRVFAGNVIFDSSAVIMAVFFAQVFQMLRYSATDVRLSFMGMLVNTWWITCCCFMIIEPPHMKRVFEKRHKAYHLLPAFIMILALGLLIHVHIEREPTVLKFCRGMSFAVLSIAWVYIVGINQTQSIEPLRDNSSHFVSRFAPVLYCPAWLAVLFGLAGVAGLCYQYYVIYLKQARADHAVEMQATHKSGHSTDRPEEPLTDDLEMFRQAKLAQK